MDLPDRQSFPTLTDVARAAGVSTATVSRCLNTSGKVSGATRERVMRAVETLGYTPNFGARALAAKRTFTIGAIIPTMENAIFARGLQAFQETLHDKGYTLLVSSTAYRPDREAEQIRTLVARGADGLLLIGYERDPEIYDFLRSRRVPVLLAWAHQTGNPHPAVGFDNRGAMAALTRAVLAHGHTAIAVISGILRGNDRASERLAGIRGVLQENGLDPHALPVIETAYDIDNGARAFATLMQACDRPTVVMCVNDVLAAGAMQQARAMGIAVPEEVSITGFDDIELARLVTPQLTTVHVPHRQMGSLAARELVRMVETKGEGVSHELQSALRLRASLGRRG
ncbi:LacI family DNA-binding transcriptional regulator [Thalassococcus arenae]|uniref:LacI family DNA-binding transcriptional regulator n=1 Tax=Thalassococcus arenae TaxID=2851652 RepID=UPI0032AF5E5D